MRVMKIEIIEYLRLRPIEDRLFFFFDSCASWGRRPLSGTVVRGGEME